MTTLEDRIVPDGPTLPYPPTITYTVNNNAEFAYVRLLGWNGANSKGLTNAAGQVELDGVQLAWQGVAGTGGWGISVTLPPGYWYYQNNRPLAMQAPYEVVNETSITVHNALTLTNVANAPLCAAPGGCPPGLTLAPKRSAGTEPVSGLIPSVGPGGVQYGSGQASVAATDLESGGFGAAWGQSRSWANPVLYPFQTRAGLRFPDGTARVVWVDSPHTRGFTHGQWNGSGWTDDMLPRLRFSGDGNWFTMTGTAKRSYLFQKFNSTTYVTPMDDGVTAGMTGGEVTVTDGDGNRTVYHDGAVAQPELRGRLKRYHPAAGATVEVTAYTAAGDVAEVRRAQGTEAESWVYTYGTTGDAEKLLAGVAQRKSTDGGATWQPVRAVEYRYTPYTDPNGPARALRAAVVRDGDLTGPVLETNYYRYYAYGEANGVYEGMKFEVGGAAFDRMAKAYGVTLDTVDTLTDAQVAAYADQAFEYHPDGRVKKVIAQGEGSSSCTAGLGTYQFAYYQNPQYGTGAEPADWAETNRWRTRTTETLPDGNQNVVYTNGLGQVMLKVFRETATGREWRSYVHFDNFARVDFTADSVAVTGYSEQFTNLVHLNNGNYTYLSDTDGRITAYLYGPSTTATESVPGDVWGHLRTVSVRHGEFDAGTPITSQTYFAHAVNGATVYPVATEVTYPDVPPAPAGPAFADDFTAAPATGWTYRGAGWQRSGGVLTQSGPSSNFYDSNKAIITGQTWAPDQEIVASVRVDSWLVANFAMAGVGVRTNTANGHGYHLVFQGSNQVRFHSGLAWGNAYAFSWQVGVWYRFRLRVSGTTLLGKVWQADQTEPAGWAYRQEGWVSRPDGPPALIGGFGTTANNSAASFDDVEGFNVPAAAGRTTTYAYQWAAGVAHPAAVTVTAPLVSAGENGPGTVDVTDIVNDPRGNPVWVRDAAGFLHYAEYDVATGAKIKEIEDVNTALTADFQNLPAGWATPAGGGLHLKTTFEVDRLGRLRRPRTRTGGSTTSPTTTRRKRSGSTAGGPARRRPARSRCCGRTAAAGS